MGIETEEFKFRVMGPKIDDLIARSDVKQKMDEYWRFTQSSEKSGSRREYGFTIQMRIESEKEPTYSFIDGEATPSNKLRRRCCKHYIIIESSGRI